MPVNTADSSDLPLEVRVEISLVRRGSFDICLTRPRVADAVQLGAALLAGAAC